MIRVATVAVAVLCLSAVAHQASANQIQNGDFENPTLTPANSFIFDIPAGASTIPHWTVTQGSVDLISDYCCGPSNSGHQFIDLVGSNSLGGLSQDFATVAHQTYSLSFAYLNNSGAGAASALVQVLDGATSLLSATVSHSNGQPWTNFLATFVASSTLTTLAFTNTLGSTNGGIFLDSVSVTATTPIPAALPLFASALGGLGFVGWRRKRRSFGA